MTVQKRDEEWHIIRIYFACEAENETVILSADHDEYKWIDPQEYANYPIIENLKDVFEAYLTSASN